ncbi:hypothetical protein MINTM005_24040 [Mycobacterium intracellulare]|nr:hypothetical protein [Mycobacterium intracellulare]BCO57160.1 hypothetical protein MINTM005_24040 [Mycobacterium intracellulare]BCO94264.1 hypothetical protein MINTM016_22400 [Mycobacterium intracellulare]
MSNPVIDDIVRAWRANERDAGPRLALLPPDERAAALRLIAHRDP